MLNHVEDVNAVYQRALEAGAPLLIESAEGLFGEVRGAGVQDRFANEWYMVTHEID